MTLKSPTWVRLLRSNFGGSKEHSFSWSRFLIFASLLVAQVLALVGMLWVSNSSTERVVQSQSKVAVTQLVHLATSTTDTYLQSAGHIVDMQRRMIEEGQFRLGTPRENLHSLRAILESTPNIDAIMIGETDGSFALARRDEYGTFLRVVLNLDGQLQMVDTNVLPSGMSVTNRELISPYDPRTRPWYSLAFKADGKVAWTDPYVFSSSGDPGITVSTLVRPKGQAPVVMAIDIRLTALSQMLQRGAITTNAHSFVIDMKGNVMASSNKMPNLPDRVPQARDFQNEPLTDLINYYRDSEYFTGEKEHWHEYVSGGKRYVSLVRSIEVQGKNTWLLGVYAPESDFMGPLREIADRQRWLIILVLLFSNFITWPIAMQAARSVWNLQRRSSTDLLTGIDNRMGFLEKLEHEVRATQAGEHILAVVMMDLDGFKAINDTYGHSAGDELLYGVTQSLLQYMAESDTLGRFGGDEFALIVRGHNPEQLEQRLRELIDQVQTAPIQISAGEHYIGVTAGLAFWSQGTKSALELLEHADLCLVAGKKIRKGRLWTAEELGRHSHISYA